MAPNSTPFSKIGNTSNMHHMPFIIVWFFNFHCSCIFNYFIYFFLFSFPLFSIVHWKRSIRCSKWVTFGCFRGLPRRSSFDIFSYPKISILFKYSYFTSISDKFFPTKKMRHHSLHIKSSSISFSYFAWNFGDSYIPAFTIYLCTQMFTTLHYLLADN